MRLLAAILVILLWAQNAFAFTYWISPSGGALTCAAARGDSDTGVAGGDSSSSSLFYITMARMKSLACGIAGDLGMFKPGIYLGPQIRPDEIIPTGVSPLNMSKILCEVNRACIIRLNEAPSTWTKAGWQVWNVRHYVIGQEGFGFDIDSVNAGVQPNGFSFHVGSSTGPPFENVTFEGNWVHNYHANGISFKENLPGPYYTDGRLRKNRIDEAVAPINSPGGDPHSVYVSARNYLVEYNDVRSSNGYSLHCWHIDTGHTMRFNRILVLASTQAGGITCQNTETGLPTNHQIYGNIIERAAGVTGGDAGCLYFRGSSDYINFYNNTCINFPFFWKIYNGAGTHSTLNNNTCVGACAVQTDPGEVVNCIGGNCAAVNPIVSSSQFTNPAARDYSLKAGSSLINAGVNKGLLTNGAPDIGAHETFNCNTASINVNIIDLTCSMADRAPVQASSTAGWTVDCSPGCTGLTVTGVSVPSTSSTIIRLVVSGFAGGACTNGMSVNLSYDSTLGDARDSARIGWTSNQPLHSFSGLPVTNNCTGGGTPPPSGLTGYYRFNNDGLDASGNGNHATLVGTNFNSGKYDEALETQAGENDYAQLPFGNGWNPFTTPITIAGGVFVGASDLLVSRSVIGSTFVSGQPTRLYLTKQGGTWRMGIQGNPANASEFTVVPGWTHLCLRMEAGAATLTVNGVTGASAGSVGAYTSYTLPGNFRIGLVENFASTSGGAHLYDEWKIYASAEDCGVIYEAWEPPVTPPDGQLIVTATRISGGKYDGSGNVRSKPNPVRVPKTGAFAVEYDTQCQVADCTPISQKLFYTCVGCPSAGTELPVPDIETGDGLQFIGDLQENGILTGNKTSTAVPVFDLDVGQTSTNRYILTTTQNAPLNAIYSIFPKEQSGLALDGYTPANGASVLVDLCGIDSGF